MMIKNESYLIILIICFIICPIAWGDKIKKQSEAKMPATEKHSEPAVKTTNQPIQKPEPIISHQQNIDIWNASFNSGGALNLTSAGYKMSVTAGQSLIGIAQSTNYKMGIGFWYGVATGPVCTDKAGDANGSGGNPNLPDIIYLVNYVFKGGTAPNPSCRGDANGSGGNPNLPDIIYLVNYVFKGGPAPVKSGVCCL